MNILIVPGTNRCAAELVHSLGSMRGINLYGGGTDLKKSKEFSYKDFFFLPDIKNRDTAIRELIELITGGNTSFDFVFFTHDQWIYETRAVPEPPGTTLMRHNIRAIEVASFKSKTYQEFSGLVKVPRLYSKVETIKHFPIFAKPDRGQGSRGISKIESEEAFEKHLKHSEHFDYVYTEFLEGPEFTIDCFSGVDGSLIFARPRIRSFILNGIAASTEIIHNPKMIEYAKIISNHLKLTGAWFFQMKEDSNQTLNLLEIGLRPGGASGIQRLLGVNQSMAWLYQASGHAIKTLGTDWSVAVTTNDEGRIFVFDRQIDSIFVDFDDTLILTGELNNNLLDFLVKSRSAGIQTALISRHKGDLEEELKKFNLIGLFDNIFHIENLQPKSAFMRTSNGNILFVDDSFSEREEVALALGSSALVLDQSFLSGFSHQGGHYS